MKEYFNKKTFCREIKDRMGIEFTPYMLWDLERKNFLKPDGYMDNGNRKVPVYTEKTIVKFIDKIKSLQKEGKIRVKILK